MIRRPYELGKDLDKFELAELIDLLNRTIEAATWTSPILNSRLGEMQPPEEFRRAGLLAYADGNNWDPGSGEGMYYLDSSGDWIGMLSSSVPGSKAFKTFTVPSGSSVVADSVADTMNFVSGHAALTITGNASTDTITFNIVPSSLPTADDIYVNETGDTMTGLLIIDPDAGSNALEARQDIVLTAGKKLIFDGVA